MTREELDKVLENHQHWLREDVEGWQNMRANLRGADLRGANLRGADLRGANHLRLMTIGEVRGVLDMAEAMKEVLKD